NLDDPAPEHTQLALRMAKGSIGVFESATRTWAKSATNDAGLLAAFTATNDAALAAARDVATGLDRYPKHCAHVRERPRSHQHAPAPGRCGQHTRLQERVETPLPELLAKGEAPLAQDRAAFIATAAKIAPGKKPAAVMEALTGEHPAADDLIPSVARGLEDAR